jgi:flagellar basal body-associated protein FliL
MEQEEKNKKEKKNYKDFFVLIIMIVVFGVWASFMAYFAISTAFEETSLRIFPLVLGIIFGGSVLFCFLAILNIFGLFQFKKPPHIDDVIAYLYKSKAIIDIKILIIFFPTLFFFVSFFYFLIKKDEIPASDLTSVTEIVKEASIKTHHKSGNSLIILLERYPDFVFTINSIAFKKTYSRFFVETVNAGDTISIDVMTDDYLKKLTKEKPNDDYRFISVYGLHDKNYAYLTLSDYNEANKSNSTGFIWLFGLLGTFCIWQMIRISTKTKNSKKKSSLR